MKEFSIIDEFFKQRSYQRKDVVLPIGDDCAVTLVPKGQQLATTTDTLVSGVHFPENTSASAIAHKSLAVSLSDLAAMGAEPAWINLSLSMPNADETWLGEFAQSLRSLCEYYSVQLIGGDTVQGPLVITITAQGFIPEKQAITRSGAKPGDLLYVTGTLGDAGMGLKLALNQQTASGHTKDYLLNRLNFPTPRVLAGTTLRRMANACIDISDGLVVDLRHVLEASGVGATLHVDNLPVSDELLSMGSMQQAQEMAMSSGDDYELLFSVSQEQVVNMERAMLHANVPVTCIGQLNGYAGKLDLQCNNQPWDLPERGFEHFSSAV